jgi:hypothetical protein
MALEWRRFFLALIGLVMVMRRMAAAINYWACLGQS